MVVEDTRNSSYCEDLLCHKLHVCNLHASIHQKKTDVNKVVKLNFDTIALHSKSSPKVSSSKHVNYLLKREN
jgi:hypothetical protein